MPTLGRHPAARPPGMLSPTVDPPPTVSNGALICGSRNDCPFEERDVRSSSHGQGDATGSDRCHRGELAAPVEMTQAREHGMPGVDKRTVLGEVGMPKISLERESPVNRGHADCRHLKTAIRCGLMARVHLQVVGSDGVGCDGSTSAAIPKTKAGLGWSAERDSTEFSGPDRSARFQKLL